MLVVIALPDTESHGAKVFFAGMKNELLLLLAVLGLIVIAIKIAYYKESLMVVLRTAATLFWLFILPGYAITVYWRQKLDFLERIVIGTVAALAVTGIISYYLGLLGLKIQNQTVLLPLGIIAVSSLAALKSVEGKGPRQQQEQKQQEQTT